MTGFFNILILIITLYNGRKLILSFIMFDILLVQPSNTIQVFLCGHLEQLIATPALAYILSSYLTPNLKCSLLFFLRNKHQKTFSSLFN